MEDYSSLSVDQLKSRAHKFSPSEEQIELKDRFNLNLYIVHEHQGDTPMVAECHGSYLLKDNESTIKRHIKLAAGTDAKLNFGWLKGKSGEIVLKSAIYEHINFKPTNQERDRMERQRIIIHYGDPSKGQFVRLGTVIDPVSPDDLCLTASEGIIPIVVWIFPR